jgi:hypothetical protein
MLRMNDGVEGFTPVRTQFVRWFDADGVSGIVYKLLDANEGCRGSLVKLYLLGQAREYYTSDGHSFFNVQSQYQPSIWADEPFLYRNLEGPLKGGDELSLLKLGFPGPCC